MEKYKIKILVICLFILLVSTSLISTGAKSSFLKTITMEDENIVPTISYIHGTVRKYPDGTPIPNAIVEFRKSVTLPWKSTRTDENGEYYIEVRNMLFFPKYYVMWAVSTGFQMLPTYIEVKNRRNFDVTKDLWLAPPQSGRIHGYITDKENNPIDDAVVELLIYPYDNAYVVLVTPKHIKIQKASELKKGKDFVYFNKCKDFETNRDIILKYIDFCKKFFGNC